MWPEFAGAKGYTVWVGEGTEGGRIESRKGIKTNKIAREEG